MGEEYGEDNPFLYFISHLDEELVRLVQEGRKKDFEAFNFGGTPPDPQDEETFNKSKLDWEKKSSGKYLTMFNWYKEIIKVRKSYSSFKNFDKKELVVTNPKDNLICMKRKGTLDEAICLFNLSARQIEFDESNYKDWEKVLDSSQREWNEDLLIERTTSNNVLSPWNVKVYIKE
jgi:maltooligosyltrehalose trehalohydrolase